MYANILRESWFGCPDLRDSEAQKAKAPSSWTGGSSPDHISQRGVRDRRADFTPGTTRRARPRSFRSPAMRKPLVRARGSPLTASQEGDVEMSAQILPPCAARRARPL